MRPRPRKPKNRYHHGSLYDAALTAAAAEIDLHGPIAFSLDGVAKRLGVTPPALYRHFESRDALIRDVIWQTFEKFVAAMDGVVLAPPGGDLLAAFGHGYVVFAMENPGWFRLQFSRAGVAQSARHQESQPRYAAVLLEELERLFGRPESAREWMQLLWTFLHGLASLHVEGLLLPADAPREARLAVVDRHIAVFLEAMRGAAQART